MADATGTSSSKAPDQLGHKGTESTEKEAELTADESRFVAELEFIQCLANPHYLAHLASSQYRHQTFDNDDFIKYLSYLQYWKRPEYARYVTSPHALFFLDKLQDPRFREELQKPQFINLLHYHQLQFYWLGMEHK